MKVRALASIKTRFVLTAAVIVAVSTAFWGWWVWEDEQRLLYAKLRDEGQLMMTSLSTPIINALLYEEMGVIEEGGLLDNFIDEIMNNGNLPAVYAFVTDQDGKVLAHNRFTEHGKIYRDSLTRRALDGHSFLCQVIGTAGGNPIVSSSRLDGASFLHLLGPWHGNDKTLLDMAMPLKIYGKSWGALRVGVSTLPLERQLGNLARRLFVFTALFFITCTGVFYLVGMRLARPLVLLSRIMTKIGPDQLEVTPPSVRRDEIGALQNSFRDMLLRLKNSEEEREKAVAHLVQAEKLATVGKLVAGVAHEVNNPISGMLTCIHNLESNPNDMLKYTDLLKNGLGRIEAIVSDLSDFSRAGDIALQEVSSGLFFHEAVIFAGLATQKRNVVLSTVDECFPPAILNVDKGKLHQVVLNLLFNAVDVSPPGGNIAMRAYLKNDFYCIAIQDQGLGVPQDEREKIFEIFYTTKAPGKGCGMGLAISRSIVEMHEGAIMVDCNDKGTTFSMLIPLPGKGEQ